MRRPLWKRFMDKALGSGALWFCTWALRVMIPVLMFGCWWLLISLETRGPNQLPLALLYLGFLGYYVYLLSHWWGEEPDRTLARVREVEALIAGDRARRARRARK